MGEISVAMNEFLRDKVRFADLFNGFCFGGEHIIKAEELQESSEQYAVEIGGSMKPKLGERQRDIMMRLKSGSMLRILAIENQNLVDYTMPFRCMQYDCLEYGRQLRNMKSENVRQKRLTEPAEWLSGIKKTERLIPVYTLCLYHGEETWDGPRSLKDMMDFGNNEDGMKNLFSDYSMRLFCVNEYADFDMLHTELREVFMALNCRQDKTEMQKLMQENEAYKHLNEDSVKVLATLLKQPRIWEEREKYMSKNGDEEAYDMCLALRELREEGRLEGRLEGRENALMMASRVFKTLRSDGNLNDEIIAQRCECDVEDVRAVRKAFGI